jgi:hypothetical protein
MATAQSRSARPAGAQPRQIAESYHLSLSIGKALWDDLMGAALPAKLKDGSFDLGRALYQGVKQLQVKEKVAALLETRDPPALVLRARDQVASVWGGRRTQVYKLIDRLVHVEGDWKVEIDREGTEFHYAPQKLGVDAHVKAVANGKAFLLDRNLELPFTLEKRLGASCHLGDIRYDKEARAIVGEIMDPAVDFGDHFILRLLNEVGAYLLQQQIPQYNPVPILKKQQVEELVSPAGGPLKLQMGVEDVALEVTEETLTLKVRFGFTQLQLPGR